MFKHFKFLIVSHRHVFTFSKNYCNPFNIYPQQNLSVFTHYVTLANPLRFISSHSS